MLVLLLLHLRGEHLLGTLRFLKLLLQGCQLVLKLGLKGCKASHHMAHVEKMSSSNLFLMLLERDNVLAIVPGFLHVIESWLHEQAHLLL